MPITRKFECDQCGTEVDAATGEVSHESTQYGVKGIPAGWFILDLSRFTAAADNPRRVVIEDKKMFHSPECLREAVKELSEGIEKSEQVAAEAEEAQAE